MLEQLGLIVKLFLEPYDVVIVILSQKEHYHTDLAVYLRDRIYDQADALRKESPRIVLSHQLNIKGSWTITPLLPYLSNNFPTAKWFFFCMENIVIRLKKLLDVFEKFNASENIWIGNALFDQHPTIIHHFARSKIYRYPHIVTGFGMTSKLLKSLSQQISDSKGPKMDFSIDAPYEFARFVLKSTNVELTHVSEICIASVSHCATYPRFFDSCNSFISSRNVYFAVKTCAKHHVDRIPVIKNSWAKYKIHIGYFSDAADKNLREAYIVPNTTEGHCAKTYDILQRANIIMKKFKHDWLVISDDDTLFNIARLLHLLTCYNPKRLIAIGERYGFRMWDRHYGYEYLTGGAGIVLSAPLVREMLRSDVCNCPSATTPDDMYLFGLCLSRLGVQPVHSLMFHQARPVDYPVAYLVSQKPISFHKFWMVDPLKDIYDKWLAPKHKIVSNRIKPTYLAKHTEL
ncbi:Beta-1,3-glucosyltransferase [Camponotus floridanus]|uniref:Beta-1,3-glucosyltransferase n=1 Tax=Camponotus floridanus TaxID=104421 RepID=E2A0W8_CAMFO|nr:Beta-1,3-glucosyltransferase [Camponotus floridanus]